MVAARALVIRDESSNGSNGGDISPGNLCLYSSSVPDLTSDVTYTATFKQTIQVKQGETVKATYPDLISKKTFQAPASPYVLEASAVHSVYPPAGHSDYWSESAPVPHLDSERSQDRSLFFCAVLNTSGPIPDLPVQ